MRTTPHAPCTAPNQLTWLKKYYFPKYPTYSLGAVFPKFYRGCSNCPSTQTYYFCRTLDPNIYMLLYPSQTLRVSTYTSPLLLHSSPCKIFSLLPRDANAHCPACSLLLDVSNFPDSRTGLCQQCLGHNVAELEAEKEVDTRVHADAEENDEKRESFEDLPEHLRLGTEFTLRVTVLQVQSSPIKGYLPKINCWV